MLFQNAISLFTVFAEIMPHMIPGLSTSEQHLNYNTGGKKNSKISPRLEKYFRVGGPFPPESWLAPPRLPRSSGPRLPDIECVHSFYILEGRGEGIHIEKGAVSTGAVKKNCENLKDCERGTAQAEQCHFLIKLNWHNDPWHFLYFCFVQKQKALYTEES